MINALEILSHYQNVVRHDFIMILVFVNCEFEHICMSRTESIVERFESIRLQNVAADMGWFLLQLAGHSYFELQTK